MTLISIGGVIGILLCMSRRKMILDLEEDVCPQKQQDRMLERDDSGFVCVVEEEK